MKRHLLSAAFALGAALLLGLAASHARADGPPTRLPKGPGDQAAPVAAPPAPGAPAQGQVAPPGAPVLVAPPAGACCPAPACCEPCLKKVCVGEKATRTIDKRVYGESCEDFCLPKCPLFSGFGHGHKQHDCGGCCDTGCDAGCCDTGCDTCTKCEHCVRERKYLVIHVRKEEECYNKCHVEYQPEEPKCKRSFHHKKDCDEGCCPPAVGGCAGVVVQTPAQMLPVEQLPNPPKEKK
jgi:hypothetical protein